jgi:hypothetical protein
MKVDWDDVDQSKWVCVQIDAKYEAVLQAARKGKKGDAQDKEIIAEHGKGQQAKTENKQAEQREEEKKPEDKPIQEVKVDFSMGEESHEIKVSMKGDQPEVEMASDAFDKVAERIMNAVAPIRTRQAAAQRAKNDAEATRWTNCIAEMQAAAMAAIQAKQAVKAKMGTRTQMTEADQQALAIAIQPIAKQLFDIGKKYDLKSFDNLGVGTDFSDKERDAVRDANKAKYGKYQCEFCGFRHSQLAYDSAGGTNGMFHVDHVVPKSHGGQGVVSNGRLLDGTCNTSRGDGDTPKNITGMMKYKGIHDK